MPPREVERLAEPPAVMDEGLAESVAVSVGGGLTCTVKLSEGLPVAPLIGVQESVKVLSLVRLPV